MDIRATEVYLQSAWGWIMRLFQATQPTGWLVQILVVLAGVWALNFFLQRVIRHFKARTPQRGKPWDGAVVESIGRPLRLLLWIVGLALIAEIIRQRYPVALLDAIEPMRELGVIATLTWFVLRLIHHIEIGVVRHRVDQDRSEERATVEALGKLARATGLVIAGLIALQTLGFSISGVLAFGGIGGIAIGFAAKDLLANFFGGLMIYLDRPFIVGDWIRSPEARIEGTVEEIGWRLTRVRTFELRPLYVPNAVFSNIAVENPSRMFNRRIFETIGIRYDDQDRVSDIISDVEQMLLRHEEIDHNRTLIVNFNTFSASSLDFFIYVFTRTTEWVRYHAVKQDVLLKVAEIVRTHDAEIAYPTSTVHLPSERAPILGDARRPPEATTA